MKPDNGQGNKGPYTIQIVPTALFLESGENSELICDIKVAADAVSNTSLPRNLSWSKDGQRDLPINVLDNGNGTLRFSSASLEMSGEYTCTTEGPHPLFSAQAIVNVLHKVSVDYYITINPQTMIIEAGKVAQLECQVETPPGAEEPGIIWLWNGSKNLPYGVFDNRRGSLKFRETKVAQSGTYTCTTDTESFSSADATVSIKSSEGRQYANHIFYSDASSKSSFS